MNIRQTTLAAALALAFIGPAHAEGLKPSAGSDRHGFEFPPRANGLCLRRPAQRSTATDLLTKSPHWSRLWLVRRRRISPART